MSGIDFLEEAMDIYPVARRVLLTAYADTHAAIEAINVVDLDHYLLKPWDPPEEKLYPVIDGLLEAWHGDRRPGHPAHEGDRPSAGTRGRGRFASSWPATSTTFPRSGRRARGQATARTRQAWTADQLPVVITEQGETLVEPPNTDIAATLGLTTMPSMEFYDLVVVGGGPAGLAAAVYGASEGLKTVLIERTATGGQAGRVPASRTTWASPTGVSGTSSRTVRAQAGRDGSAPRSSPPARPSLSKSTESARTVRFDDGSTIDSQAVILATGVSYRQLPAEG